MRCTSRSLIATQPNVRLQLAMKGGGHFYFAQGGHSNFARTLADARSRITESLTRAITNQERTPHRRFLQNIGGDL
jgi:hypothetical protein